MQRFLLFLVTVNYAAAQNPIETFQGMSWSGNSPELSHSMGQSAGIAWVATGTGSGCFTQGPNVKTLPISQTAPYVVIFTLSAASNIAPNMGVLDIYDGSSSQRTYALKGADFPSVNTQYSTGMILINAAGPSASGWEFRHCSVASGVTMSLYQISIFRYVPVVYRAAALSHNAGYATGDGAWVAPLGSPTYTAFVYGPYERSPVAIPVGPIRVEFLLSIDSVTTNSGTDMAVRLDVAYDGNGGVGTTAVGMAVFYRNSFAAANTPQIFTLTFNNGVNAARLTSIGGFEYRVWTATPVKFAITAYTITVCADLGTPCALQFPTTQAPSFPPTPVPVAVPTLAPTGAPHTALPTNVPTIAPTTPAVIAPSSVLHMVGERANITFGPQKDLAIWRSSSTSLTVTGNIELPGTATFSGRLAQPTGYGTTLDAAAVDGQVGVLVDNVQSPSYSWRFRYNGKSLQPHRWEFLGGASLIASTTTIDVLSQFSWGGSEPRVTLPNIGVYEVTIEAIMLAEPPGGCSAQLALEVGKAPIDPDAHGAVQYFLRLDNDFHYVPLSFTFLLNNPAPFTDVVVRHTADPDCIVNAMKRVLKIRPMRVQA